MCGNYDQMSEDARKLFLASDQEAILAKFRLKHTADAMFIRFLNREYRIDRSSGSRLPIPGRRPAMMKPCPSMTCCAIQRPHHPSRC